MLDTLDSFGSREGAMMHEQQVRRFVFRALTALLWCLLLPTLASARTAAVPGSLHAQLQALDADPAQPVAERLAAMRRAYAHAAPEVMQQADCAALPDARLQDLFESTALVAFYAREPATLVRLQCLYDVLVARDLAAEEQHRAMRGSFIVLQRFEQANALNSRLSNAPTALPEIRGSVLPGKPLLRLHSLVEVERATLAEDGLRVVAVVHPYCGFSQRALEAITTRPEYAWLRDHLQLVVPNGQGWPGQEMLDWNAAHPTLPMRPMVADTSWQVLDTGQTPVFYLLRDGKVVDTVTGWAPEGADLRAIRAALEGERR
ncbi:hypothetical protein KQ945_06390 [Bacillus subtilis subsp. subtilis]|nr:hypothetical protein [Bacillus subtilis subsp. subtilis]